MDVGVAWVSLEEKGYIYLSKVSDGHTFSQTLALLKLLKPSEILLSDVRKVRWVGLWRSLIGVCNSAVCLD